MLTRSQYVQAGAKHVCKDKMISYDQLHSVQKLVNDHSKWLKRIFNIGCEWGHDERIAASMPDKGEVVSPLYLLIKDHKGWSPEDGTPPPSRPICSGRAGFNRHISEILSMVLEPLGHALGGYDIDSTGGLLSKVGELNKMLRSGHERDGVFNREINMANDERGVFNMSPNLKEVGTVNSSRENSSSNKPVAVSSDHENGVFNRSLTEKTASRNDQCTGVFNSTKHIESVNEINEMLMSGHEEMVFSINKLVIL